MKREAGIRLRHKHFQDILHIRKLVLDLFLPKMFLEFCNVFPSQIFVSFQIVGKINKVIAFLMSFDGLIWINKGCLKYAGAFYADKEKESIRTQKESNGKKRWLL